MDFKQDMSANQLAGIGAGRMPEFIEMMQVAETAVPARLGSWIVRLRMKFAAIILLFGLPLLAGCSRAQLITGRCAAINAQFTNGTPMSQVVAKLGQPDWMHMGASLSIPEDTNNYLVCVYHFDSGDVMIIDTAEQLSLLEFSKRRFIHASVLRQK
jgi:hypothetical protein